MSETLLAERHETTLHPEWDMAVRHDRLETERDLLQSIEGRLHVFDEQERATEGKVTGFLYDPAEYDTHLELSDEDGTYDVQVSLPDFLHSGNEDENPDGWRVRRQITEDIAADYMHRSLNGRQQWWLDLDSMSHLIDTRTMSHGEPTEQVIIGQKGRGVRFFNYGEAMSEARLEDCRKFIDIATAYFGDRVYDILGDVVIAPFDQQRDLGRQEGKPDTEGFIPNGTDKVLVVDAKLLADEEQETSARLDDEGAGRFIEVLLHEFGHLLHGNDPEAERELLEFAEEVGWDVKNMLAKEPEWTSRYADLAPFVPSDDYVVKREDGTTERMSLTEYYDRYDDEYDDEGNIVRPGLDYHRLGSPTGYGETNPKETFADTTAYALLGTYVMRMMPDTHDAWLRHAERRAGQPLATPINRAPIVVDRRTGQDIVYPETELPDTIYVRALPRRQPAHA